MESESKTVTTNTFAVDTYNPYIPKLRPVDYGTWKEWDEAWNKSEAWNTSEEILKKLVEDCNLTKIKDVELSVPKFVINLGSSMDISIKPGIKKVIFNPPATIVYWQDGTKTVVKCTKDEIFNESAGVALCFMKRFCEDYRPALKNAIKTAERPIRKDKKDGK